MRDERLYRTPWSALLAMLLAAWLALWLLWRPELLGGLPLILRLPAIVLGVWALGAGFMQGLGLAAPEGWPRRLTTPPACWGALAAFTLIVLGRAWSL